MIDERMIKWARTTTTVSTRPVDELELPLQLPIGDAFSDDEEHSVQALLTPGKDLMSAHHEHHYERGIQPSSNTQWLSGRNEAMDSATDHQDSESADRRPSPAENGAEAAALEPESMEAITKNATAPAAGGRKTGKNLAPQRRDEPDFLTLDELSAVLRASEMTIRRLIRRDRIPSTFVAGRWLFPRRLILEVWTHDADLAMRLWRDEPNGYLKDGPGRRVPPETRGRRAQPVDDISLEFPLAASVLARANGRSGG